MEMNELVLKALKDANDAQQEGLERQVKDLVHKILTLQCSMADTVAKIAEYKKQLAALQPPKPLEI